MTTRRQFLRSGLGAAAAFCAPAVIRPGTFGIGTIKAPNDLINLAVIGLGGKGFRGIMGSLLRSFIGYNSCRVVAVCDVDRTLVEGAVLFVNSAYGNSDCKGYTDFRDILLRKDIDAVVIATPDHWHADMTIMACESGKDVYCEKALVNSLEQTTRVVEAARRYDRVVQAGSQSRSNPEFAFACRMIREGMIGEVRRVVAGSHGNPAWWNCQETEEPLPEGLDWNLWLGPAPYHPYSSEIRRHWRRWKDFGGGGIADRGAHHFDVAHWGLGFDDQEPVKIIPPDGAEMKFLTFVYRDGTEMIVHYDHDTGKRLTRGVRFIGTEGDITLDAISVTATYNPEALGRKYQGEKVGRKTMPDNPHGTGHYGNFLECIHSRQRPNADVEIAAHSTAVCLLGNAAHWMGRPLSWDPVKKTFPHDQAANRLISVPERREWMNA